MTCFFRFIQTSKRMSFYFWNVEDAVPYILSLPDIREAFLLCIVIISLNQAAAPFYDGKACAFKLFKLLLWDFNIFIEWL